MWKGVLCVVLVGVVGVATTQRTVAKSPVCKEECSRFYSLHTNQFEQINESWSSCLSGCDFFQRIQARTGQDPIQALKNCNFSCDERYAGEQIHACQAGCGFNYDVATTQIPMSPRIEAVPSSQPFVIPLSLSLPKLFGQIHRAMPRLNQMMERTFSSSPFNDDFQLSMPSLPAAFSSLPAMPRLPGGFLGRKDTEEEQEGSAINDFLDSINDQMNHMMQSMPAMPRIESLNPWSAFPFGQSSKSGGGKITVVNAGPGFVEEKHYDIKPDGEIVEVTNTPHRLIIDDGLDHENPMESNFVNAEVELIQPEFEQAALPEVGEDVAVVSEPVEAKPEEDGAAAADRETEEAVADVNDVEQAEKADAETKAEAEEAEAAAVPLVEVRRPELRFEAGQMDPFLHILRNSISERERSQLYNQYKSLNSNNNDDQYVDNNSCSSEHLRWSDWVGCVHVRLGVPRWLTAATIALGIVFSVWLCFIIPTAAPKQRLAHLMIHTEKLALPSSTVKSKQLSLAEAKAAEAEATNEAVIAVIKVDLPPSYGDVAPGSPGSPAPSYKSDMLPAMPGSPAPSYKSVDVPVKVTDGEKSIEPVHGKDSQA